MLQCYILLFITTFIFRAVTSVSLFHGGSGEPQHLVPESPLGFPHPALLKTDPGSHYLVCISVTSPLFPPTAPQPFSVTTTTTTDPTGPLSTGLHVPSRLQSGGGFFFLFFLPALLGIPCARVRNESPAQTSARPANTARCNLSTSRHLGS